MAIGAISRDTRSVAPSAGDLTAASAADLRLLRGAFRAAGIDLQPGDVAFARSTLTRFEAEVGLRNGQVVEPWRRADSALVVEMDRHADSGASVNSRIVDIRSGKILSENRTVALRPRPPYQTADDIEAQFNALSGSLRKLQGDRQLTADSEGEIDRRATPRVIPTSHRDINLLAQEAAFIELNMRATPRVDIQDLGENRRIEEELERIGRGKGKDKDKDKGKGKAAGTPAAGNLPPGLSPGDLLSAVRDALGQRGNAGRNVDINA
ncbi:MAG: hypothetical protein FJZ01_07360 [Candidatus Sericytochromatia bacterium]|nr:hypothetical protein [Candidatus Tanganyikabacteria bacterium]